MIEPVEHLVEFLSEDDADDRKRQSPEFYRLTEHATEDLRRFAIGQLAAGNLERLSDEIPWTLKGERGERSDVIGGDRLKWLLGTNRVHQLAPQNPDLDLIDVVVFHEGRGPQNCRRETQPPNVLLNLPLALPMVDPGIALGAADRAVDEVRDAGLFRCVGQVLALLHFAPRADRPEILNAVDTVGALNDFPERVGILEVAPDHLDALERELRATLLSMLRVSARSFQ
jgi:hypothetical protein